MQLNISQGRVQRLASQSVVKETPASGSLRTASVTQTVSSSLIVVRTSVTYAHLVSETRHYFVIALFPGASPPLSLPPPPPPPPSPSLSHSLSPLSLPPSLSLPHSLPPSLSLPLSLPLSPPLFVHT